MNRKLDLTAGSVDHGSTSGLPKQVSTQDHIPPEVQEKPSFLVLKIDGFKDVLDAIVNLSDPVFFLFFLVCLCCKKIFV